MSRTYRANQKPKLTNSKQKVERRKRWQRVFNKGRNKIEESSKVAFIEPERLFCPKV